MEGYLFKWVNIIVGWKPRYISINNGCIEISVKKEDEVKKKYNIDKCLKIINDKKIEFTLDFGFKKVFLKAMSELEKASWILAIKNEETKEIEKNNKTCNSNTKNKKHNDKASTNNIKEVKNNKLVNISNNDLLFNNSLKEKKENDDLDQIKSNSLASNVYNNIADKIKNSVLNIQNDVLELNNYIIKYSYMLEDLKDKKSPFFKFYDDLIHLKYNLRSNLDEILTHTTELKNFNNINNKQFEMENTNNKSIIFYDAVDELKCSSNKCSKPFNSDYLDKNNKSISSNSSYEDCEDLANIDINFGPNEMINLERKLSQKNNKAIFYGLSKKSTIIDNNNNNTKNQNYNENEFIIDNTSNINEEDAKSKNILQSYLFKKRCALSSNIKSSNSMISDLVKAAMKEKATLPITYNEPISMLQRQVETFQFYNLLQSSFNLKNNVPYQLAYIAAFVVADVSLSINRLLKPFNPILGETYEYIDLDHKFRAFCEQVSHHPPISAYLIEGENITVYGDTKHKHKTMLLKGAIEMNFSSKTHILFHSDVKSYNDKNNSFQKNNSCLNDKTLSNLIKNDLYLNNSFTNSKNDIEINNEKSNFFKEAHNISNSNSKNNSNLRYSKTITNSNNIRNSSKEIYSVNNNNYLNNNDDSLLNFSEDETQIHYTFNKPTIYLKGLYYGTPRYDFSGKTIIEDNNINEKYLNNLINKENNDKLCSYKLELEFNEEGKNKMPNGTVEGKIIKYIIINNNVQSEVINILKGNWKENLKLYDSNGDKELLVLWNIDSDNEKYITNTDQTSNYLLSNYAYNLNYLPKELIDNIPKSDSRIRPDQRLLEEGNIEKAEIIKTKLEDLQRKKAKKLEEEKKKYLPIYFESVNDLNDGNFYIPKYNNNYWEDRKNYDYSKLDNVFDFKNNNNNINN